MKNYNALKVVVFLLLLTFYATLLTYEIKLPVADDMARHVKNGELIVQGNFDILYQNVYSYTDFGHPFVNHHWFSGVIFYLFHNTVGWGGLVILKVIILLSSFSLLFFTALKKANFWLISALSLPTIIIFMERTSLRPEIFSYFFISLYIYFLIDFEEHPDKKKIFWLIPLQLLWVNMHIFWSIGLMIVAGFIFEKIIVHYKNLKNSLIVKKLVLIFFVLIAVSFINPHGLNGVLYRYPPDFPIKISENQSIAQFQKIEVPGDDLAVLFYKPMVFLLAVSMILGLKKKRLSIFYLLGSIATTLLGFVILRGIYFFGMFFLLAVSMSLNEYFLDIVKRLDTRTKVKKTVIPILTCFFLAILMYLILPSTTKRLSPFIQPGIGLSPSSLNSATFFKEQGLHGPIFNDPDSGSYLIYTLYPKEKVFTDNLFADAYSASLFSTYLSMIESEDVWLRESEKYNFNVIFFYQYNRGPNVRRFLYNRMTDPQWPLIYADRYNVIFVKNVPQNQEVIEKFAITRENVFQRLIHLLESEDFDDQVAAADVFNLIGRTDLGMTIFLNILAKWPDNRRMWMIVGEWELNNDNPKSPLLAAMYLDKAISLGQRSAEAYAFLGAAYAKAGQIENAKGALRKALTINPERQDAYELLQSLEGFKIQ